MSEEIPERPQWLDDVFLRTCIKNSQSLDNESNIQIKDLALTYVVPKGENFMSVLYRAVVTYQIGKGQVLKEPFVVKVSHSGEMAKVSNLMCDVEIDIYLNYLTELDKIFKQKGLATQLACRYFHAINEPTVIVFEDLKPLGFVLGNRHVGMDMEHSKAVYTKMAQFHAGGMYYFHSQPDEAKAKYAKSGFEIAFEGKTDQIIMAQKAKIKINIKELEKYDNKYTKAIDYLKKYSDHLAKSPIPITPTVPGSKFNSMIHTDLLVNNVMFRYKQDGILADVILVDFQTCYYASIAYDFIFFFITSTSLELKKNNYVELKKFYLDSLVNTLKELGYKGEIPTMQEFDEELKRHTSSAMFSMIVMLQGVVQRLDDKKKSRAKSEALSIDDIAEIMQNSQGDRNYLDKMVASIDILQDFGFMDKPLK